MEFSAKIKEVQMSKTKMSPMASIIRVVSGILASLMAIGGIISAFVASTETYRGEIEIKWGLFFIILLPSLIFPAIFLIICYAFAELLENTAQSTDYLRRMCGESAPSPQQTAQQPAQQSPQQIGESKPLTGGDWKCLCWAINGPAVEKCPKCGRVPDAII